MKPQRRSALGALLAGAVLSMLAMPASAADWPAQKPISYVVPFTVGGSTDVVGRVLAQKLGDRLHQNVIVENKPGAAGGIGATYVAKAPPDGYTFLYNLSTAFTINPYIYARLPFDPQKDLVPVATTMRQGLVLIASPKLPAKSIKELLATAKAKPGSISHASYGAGSPSHLIVEWLKDETGTDMLHVPYRASPVADVIGGQVDTVMEPIATGYPLISSGRVQALAYSGPSRHPAMPEVPTLAEVVPGLTMTSWHGLWAPAATPAAIQQRFNAVMIEASKDPDLAKRIRELNSEPLGLTQAEMTAALRRDAEIYSRIVKAKNIRVD